MARSQAPQNTHLENIQLLRVLQSDTPISPPSHLWRVPGDPCKLPPVPIPLAAITPSPVPGEGVPASCARWVQKVWGELRTWRCQTLLQRRAQIAGLRAQGARAQGQSEGPYLSRGGCSSGWRLSGSPGEAARWRLSRLESPAACPEVALGVLIYLPGGRARARAGRRGASLHATSYSPLQWEGGPGGALERGSGRAELKDTRGQKGPGLGISTAMQRAHLSPSSGWNLIKDPVALRPRGLALGCRGGTVRKAKLPVWSEPAPASCIRTQVKIIPGGVDRASNAWKPVGVHWERGGHTHFPGVGSRAPHEVRSYSPVAQAGLVPVPLRASYPEGKAPFSLA